MMRDKTLWYGAHANTVDAKSGEHLQFWDRWHLSCVGLKLAFVTFREPTLYQIHCLTKRKPPASNQHGSLLWDYQIARFRYLRHFRSLVHRWWWGLPPSMCPLYPPGIRDSDLRGFFTLKMPFWLPLVIIEFRFTHLVGYQILFLCILSINP